MPSLDSIRVRELLRKIAALEVELSHLKDENLELKKKTETKSIEKNSSNPKQLSFNFQCKSAHFVV